MNAAQVVFAWEAQDGKKALVRALTWLVTAGNAEDQAVILVLTKSQLEDSLLVSLVGDQNAARLATSSSFGLLSGGLLLD